MVRGVTSEECDVEDGEITLYKLQPVLHSGFV